MSNCCSSTCETKTSVPGFCPECGAKGKGIPTLTVKNLVRDHSRVEAGGSYSFCRAPQCEVVYFGPASVFLKADVKVRVGLKETEDPIPLCYCFGYTRADVHRDLEEHGRTEIPDRIKAEVQNGFCACEVKNPAGTCCLGDINRAIKEARPMRVVAKA